jgi:hypothetical protein
MPDLPSHPDDGTAARSGPASGPAIAGRSRGRKVLVIAAVLVLLAVFVVLHLTGVVGGEGH